MSDKKYAFLKKDGIAVKTDIGLYSEGYVSPILLLASVYGAAQQIRALFSMLSMNYSLSYEPFDGDTVTLYRETKGLLRLKSTSIGYGKQHGLIWADYSYFKDTKIIYWFSPEEKDAALYSVLSKRRIPITKHWLPWVERLLVDNEYFIPLRGWGGIQGYLCEFSYSSDDYICDLLCEKLKVK